MSENLPMRGRFFKHERLQKLFFGSVLRTADDCLESTMRNVDIKEIC
jgi:hypothetical protein